MNYFIRIYLGLCCAIALLTACAKDDIPSDEKLMVTFALTSSEDITRAYGNGAEVNDLRYAIYPQGDYDDPLVTNVIEGAFDGASVSTTFQEELIAGNKYTILFWADHNASDTYINNAYAYARYSINWETNIVTLNTDNLTAQDETLDAFFAKKDFTASSRVSVTLTRPFAQLNIATDDYDENASNGIVVTHTALQIEAYTSFNLVTGEVGNLKTLTFDSAAIPLAADATIEVGGKPYRCLSMNYILVGSEEYTPSATLTVHGTRDDEQKKLFSCVFNDVSLKRNRRTNVVGSIINKNTN